MQPSLLTWESGSIRYLLAPENASRFRLKMSAPTYEAEVMINPGDAAALEELESDGVRSVRASLLVSRKKARELYTDADLEQIRSELLAGSTQPKCPCDGAPMKVEKVHAVHRTTHVGAVFPGLPVAADWLATLCEIMCPTCQVAVPVGLIP